MSDKAAPPRSPVFVAIAAIVAFIGAVAALLSQLENIHDAWCKYLGIFCAFEVSSAPITVSAGGTNDGRSDICKSKSVPLCLFPTTNWRKLYVGSYRFVATAVEGNYDDGDPKKVIPSMAGWYPDPANITPEKICVIVFARTGACETRFSVTGKLTATEHISW